MNAKETSSLLKRLTTETLMMGELKKIAKTIKKDHDLAMSLWDSGAFQPRMLAVLIMDKKELTQDVLDKLADDLGSHNDDERARISEWLLANQLMKDKDTKALLESWENHQSPTLRRLFWYHQGRLRWTGQTPPDNTVRLLDALDSHMAKEESEVQWAMNFTAGWIGVHDPKHRERCLELGERLGLYKDLPVAKNCTPDYLPEFIRIEAAKLK
ncbi:MAG: DNA alkylation repair protein [Pseudomonadota bacterium]